MGIKLENILLIPNGGICNRLRAIASSRRITDKYGINTQCYWDWGDHEQIFAKDELTNFVSEIPKWKPSEFLSIIHKKTGGYWEDRLIPVNLSPKIKLESQFIFDIADSTDKPLNISDILQWLPKPTNEILSVVEQFRKNNLKTVGIHIRRTDHILSKELSPDILFCDEIHKAISKGYKIFLSSDNTGTIEEFCRKFGNNITIFPKKTSNQRWPRQNTSEIDVIEDLIDLYLLANCEYVIGSSHSSFSGTAIALNGSPMSSKVSIFGSINVDF